MDGKLLTTARILFRRPGQLALDHWEGRRARYLAPLRLYLIATALFFTLASVTGGWLNADGPFAFPAGLVNRFPELQRIGAEISPERFEPKFEFVYKLLVVLSVAGLALALRLLVGGRPYGAYLIGALHLVSFLFLVTLPLEWLIRATQAGPVLRGAIAFAGIALIYWPYAAMAIRRWSGRSWGWVLGRLAVFIVFTVALDTIVGVIAALISVAWVLRG